MRTCTAGVGCQFESYTCRNKNVIGEEGNGKPPHKIHFPRNVLRALSPVSAKLKNEYALEFYEKTVGQEVTGSHLINLLPL